MANNHKTSEHKVKQKDGFVVQAGNNVLWWEWNGVIARVKFS